MRRYSPWRGGGVGVGGAKHAGEFMRRYSPWMGGGVGVGGANHVGEFMRRYSPLVSVSSARDNRGHN